MKKSYLTVFLILFTASSLFSQIDKEITSFVDSTELRVNNGKKMLLTLLQEKDYSKVADVYSYLSDLSKLNDCNALSVIEKLYLLSITDNWQEWLSVAKNYKNNPKRICYPNSYKIIEALYDMVKAKSNKANPILNNTKLSAEENDLIKLYFLVINKFEKESEYKKAYKAFKSNYPNSNYNNFIKDFFPTPKVKGYWGYSFGPSFTFPTSNLAKTFDSNTNFHMSMDFSISKVYVSLYMTGGAPKLKQSFEVQTFNDKVTYHAEEKFSYFEGGLSAGYYVFNKKYIKIAPLLTIGGTHLESNRYKDSRDNDKEFSVYNGLVYGAGLHNEVKLFEFKSSPNYYGYTVNSLIYLKFDAGYNIIAKNNTEFFKGNNAYIRVAIGWGMGDF